MNESAFNTLLDIEDVIKQANEGTLVKLSSGTISKRHGALRDAARLQALTTLARNSKDGTLLLQDSSNYDEILNELCNYAPGLTSARLNKSINIGSKNILRRASLLHAQNKVIASDRLQFDKFLKGRSIDLSCISGADRQFISPLFTKRDRFSVKNSSQMKQTMISIFKAINNREFNNLDSDLINAFGFFGCELFKNTQEHACTDENGLPYIAHVEGLITSWGDLLSSVYKQDFMGNEKLVNYWNNNATSSNDSTETSLRCMQVSFFDTGPGLVKRAFGNAREQGLLTEKEALLKCIGRNFTTKEQTGGGNGYPTILTQLSKVGGLIRIRSGNQCIFNCFDKHNHSFWDNLEDPSQRSTKKEQYLMDFNSWDNENLSQASGTVVSIIVPLRKSSGQHNLF
ncbi:MULTISPECIES: hypothetical protein [unclassified Pseudoalteromonas]|uniref:hypothetical protein n=1 Tax=unclassified Pseudoalteromonas TaxID=194690 RepID=UPI0013FE4C98|nr:MULTISPECIES: hypothetical protein [unclassified Pseudoalteromonas]